MYLVLGDLELDSKLIKRGGWGYGLEIGWRVCNMIFVSLQKLDHRGDVNNFGP